MRSVGKRLLENSGGAVLVKIQRRLARKSQIEVEVLGAKLGRTMFRMAKRRRLRAMENLKLAFPDMGERARLLLTQRVFEHFGRSSFDFLASKGRTLEELEASTEICGSEHLEAAVARGKGTLLVTAHFGNWERIPAWLSLKGYDVGVIIRNADQEGVNQVVNELRTSPGTEVIPRGDSARSILTKLRRNGIVGIISDQNADDLFLPFFGKPAGTNLGAGVIHARTDASILPCSCAYVSPGRYRMTFSSLLEPVPGCSTKGEGLLRSINAWTESVIREHPEQWLWFHDRWRNARERGLL